MMFRIWPHVCQNCPKDVAQGQTLCADCKYRAKKSEQQKLVKKEWAHTTDFRSRQFKEN